MNAIVLGIIAVAALAVIATVIGLSAAAVRGSGRRVSRSRNRARSYDGSSSGIWTGGGDSGGWSGDGWSGGGWSGGGWGGDGGGSCGGGDGGGGGGSC